MIDEKSLTPAMIHQIAWQVRDGEADPEDARTLLNHFYSLVEHKQQVPYELTRHIANCLRDQLVEGKSLEAAFGLVRRRGRIRKDEQINIAIAKDFLRYRLKGKSATNARMLVQKERSKGRSSIEAAWSKYKFEALVALRCERDHATYPWSDDEVHVLTKIFQRYSWFISPDKE